MEFGIIGEPDLSWLMGFPIGTRTHICLDAAGTLPLTWSLQVPQNGLEIIEVIRTRSYLLTLLLLAIAWGIFASSAQAHEVSDGQAHEVAAVAADEACCCEPLAPGEACCCCEVQSLPSVVASDCQMRCNEPITTGLAFPVQPPMGFSLRLPALHLELPKPPQARPQPPKRLVSRVLVEWVLPPSPPVASLNINLPPPSLLLS